MNKCVIPVPGDIRFISDWAEKENGYRLENFPFKHIVDKQLTGCGFTEYCLRNNLNIILCSPRRMLLENKAQQHWREPNIMYFRNDLESVLDPGSLRYDKELGGQTSGPARAESIVTTVRREELMKEQMNMAKEGVLKLRESFSNNFKNIYCLWKTGYKILVTYDSFRHVKEILTELGVLESFFVVIDEFQSIFVDSKFKSEAELELLYNLQDVEKVCYVSATPMLDKYLDMLEEFRDLPFYEFDWSSENPVRVIKPEIEPVTCNSIPKMLSDVISDYQKGKFEVASGLNEDGKIVEVESREAVFYVNSVKHICSLIKSNKLTPEETNVLCARTSENEKKVRQAFRSVIGKRVKDFETVLGSIPTYGEPHKMFTFCTRTVYLGADFYSTNARSFIASDANLDSLSVDISLDLPQILGRQRLDCNPWKNRAVMFIKTITNDRLEDARLFNERIREKEIETQHLLEAYGDTNSVEAREALARKFKSDAESNHYKKDYVAVNGHARKGLLPVKNMLVLVADRRTFDIQQLDYRDRATVLNVVETDNRVLVYEVDQVVKRFYELTKFKDKMDLVCNTGFDTINQQYFLQQIPIAFGNYYNTIGPDKIKTILSRNLNIKSEYERLKSNQALDVRSRIIAEFPVGLKISASNAKEKLREIYESLGYNSTPKATDLLNYFDCANCSVPRSADNPKIRDKGYRILSIKQ